MTNDGDQQPTAGELLDQHAQEIMAVLGETLRLPGLAFDEENKCVFTIENRFVFIAYFDYANSNCIILNVPLGYLPEGAKREKLLTAMMSGNYCWNLTEGGTLGLDDQTGQLALSYLIPLPMAEKTQIIDIVGKLISSADYWMREIEQANKQSDEGTTGDAGPMLRI